MNDRVKVRVRVRVRFRVTSGAQHKRHAIPAMSDRVRLTSGAQNQRHASPVVVTAHAQVRHTGAV